MATIEKESRDINAKAEQVWHMLNNDQDLSFARADEILAELRILTRDKNLTIETSLNQNCIEKLVKFASDSHVEAQKCLSNIILNYAQVRGHIIEPYTKCVESRLQSYIKNSETNTSNNSQARYNLTEVIYYDLRIVFLLSALCCDSRTLIRDKLSDLIFILIDKETDRYSKDNHSLIIEALKTLFNLTMEECTNQPLAAKIVTKLLAVSDVRRSTADLSEQETNLKTEELLINLIHLLTNMPDSIYIDTLTEDKAAKILDHLDCQLKSKQSGQGVRDAILPLLNCCTNICKYNESIRKSWFERIILSITDFEKRPEHYDTLRGRIVKLMTSVDVHLKDIAADFMYCLCEKDVEKFITYTGLGNAASFLSARGLLGDIRPRANEDSPPVTTDQDGEAYKSVRDRIDPITGMLERPRKNKELDNMTESEKEFHAEELGSAITRLANLGLMKPVQIDSEGKIRDINPATDAFNGD